MSSEQETYKETASTLASGQIKLKVTAVNTTFQRDGEDLPVLRDINLTVGKGEFICLLGPSGCGKSTLLSTMAGLSCTRYRLSKH